MKVRTLEELLERALSHPVYAGRLESVRTFKEVPLLTKDELRRVLRKLETHPAFRDGVYWSPSGCSTARARFFFPTDVRENHYQRALFARELQDYDALKPGVVVLNLFPATHMYRASEIFTEFAESCGATVLPMTSSAPPEKTYEVAERFQVNAIMGSTSRLLAFSRFLEKEGKELEVERLLFAGEPLTSPVEAFLRRVLKIKRFFGVYGSAETGVWGLSREPDLSRYDVSSKLMHLEEYEGKIVATNMVRYRHPVLRYEMGDTGRVVKTEFGFSVHLAGREERTIKLKGQVYGLSEIALLANQSLNYQIVLSGEDRLALRVVGLNQAEVNALEGKVRSLLGESASVQSVCDETLQRAVGSDKVLRIVQQ